MNRTPWLLLVALLPLAGCATLGTHAGQALVPTRHQTRTGPYLVYTNAPVAADAPEIRHLQSLERQLEATLGLSVDPRVAPIEVYILDDQQAFAHFLTFYYPELPHRRAFFLAQGERRVVYTFRGDRLEEDLRHEATHALLHAAAADLPLWLDEGLAEYFECPEARAGRNVEHLARLPADLQEGWTPDLPRLEALKDVRQMTPRDYRESWAWVHFLLSGTPEGKMALVSYLADLHARPDAEPLSRRLEAGGGNASLIAHVRHIETRPVAAAGAAPSLRLQDAPVDAPPRPRRRGLLGRLRDSLSF